MNTSSETLGTSYPAENAHAFDVLDQWRRFFQGQDLDTPPRPVIYESWLRCREAGVDPELNRGVRRASEDDLARRLQAHAELLTAARPHLDWASNALGLAPVVIFLVDRDGVVLETVGDRSLMQKFGLALGCDRSERALGANGAGTALATNEPVAVIGPEHYCRPLHGSACLGAPLHARDGSVFGAVGISTAAADAIPDRVILIAHLAYAIDREFAYREESRRVEQEQLAAAEALRQNEDRLQLMADALPVLISYIDADCRYRFNNAAYERWFGIPPDAVRGRHVADVLGRDAYQALKSRVAAALAGIPQSFEARVPYQSAGLRDVHVDYVPHRLSDGQVAGFYALIADVTERRRADEALRENEKLTRSILNALTAHIAVLDAQGVIIAVNTAWERFARASDMPAPDRLGVGMNYLDVCRRAARDDDPALQVLAGLERVLDGSLEEFNIEYPCHTPSEKRWFLLHATPLSADRSGAVVSHTSVTELKRIEEALRESERRWHDLAEALPQLVWTCTPDGQCDFLSRQWVAYTGKPEDEQLDYGWLEQVHPEDRDRLTSAWSEAVASGKLFDIEFRIRRADGVYRWFKTRAMPVLDGDGRVAKWFGSNTDIEDLKLATASLHESEERFRAFMDNTSAVAWMKDEQGRYVYLNRPFQKRFRVQLEDWRGKSDFEVWPREVAEVFRQNDQDVLRAGQPLEVVEHTLTPGVCRCTWLTSKFPFRDASGQTYVGGIGIDITERKVLEREVLEIAALEQRRIGQELHDSVGQELTGLGLLADALAQRLTAAPRGAAELAEKVVRGIGRVRRQVRSLSHGLVPVEVDPEGLRAALEQLAASAGESSECVCTFESNGPLTATDPDLATHLFRIAQEAVSNALRHSEARHIRIALRVEPEALTLNIADDGVGFSEPPRGIKGLGLRLMRYRAGIIGGTLTVGPVAGGGTLVTCRIPLGANHGHEHTNW